MNKYTKFLESVLSHHVPISAWLIVNWRT